MNETILKIMITFFPGIIVTSILQLFNPRNKKFSNVEFTLYSFVYGMITNLLISIVFKTGLDFSLTILPTKKDLFISFGFALFLGTIVSLLRNCGFLHNLAFKFHISYEHGFSNALDFIYNSSFPQAKEIRRSFVNIKLLDGSASYYGELIVQEIHPTYTEIVLKKPDIFFKNNRKSLIYEQDAIYLQLIPGTFFMEFAFVPKNNNKSFFLKYFVIYLFFLLINILKSFIY
ncbi:MAG: hypothetical protein ACRC1R_00655 [Cetobacterium sp.]|uniref:hypothetical protein n=1 Tax=Cetobacterium sp. TaxID=2071632 RepID=UPI003F2FE0E1